jgi:PKD repeat protein
VADITIEVAFDISEPPTAEIAPSGETWVAVGQLATVTVTATGAPAPSLVWSYDGGVPDVDSTASMKVLSWSTPGRKRVACTVSNVGGQVVVESFVNVYVPKPSINELVDSFNTDTGLWPGSYGGVVRANGEVSIAADAGYPALWTSPNQYSVVGGSVYAEMVVDTPPAGANEFMFELREDNQNLVSFYVSGINFAIVTRKAGVLAEHLRGAYDPAAMRFVRFTADLPGRIAVQHSSDGIQYATLWTFTPETCPISGYMCDVIFQAGQWEAGPGTLRILGVNSVQPPPVTVPAEVWNGTSWQSTVEVWNGTRWRSDAEMWTGSEWIPLGNGG